MGNANDGYVSYKYSNNICLNIIFTVYVSSHSFE